MQRILIIGGGFAGFWAAVAAQRELTLAKNRDVQVTLMTPQPVLVIRPRLYEANPEHLTADIATPLATIGVQLLLGRAQAIDLQEQSVSYLDEAGLQQHQTFDRLILTLGSQLKLPNLPGLQDRAFSVDSQSDAQRLQKHLAKLFSTAPQSEKPSSAGRKTIAVLGAGFTGLELACELRSRLSGLAGQKAADAAKVLLIDHSDRPGAHLGEGSQAHINAALDQAGVTFLGNRTITRLEQGKVHFTEGPSIECQTLIVTTGLTAHPLGQTLAEDLGLTCDDLGRLPTQKSLQLPGSPHILVAGDLARAKVDEDHLALMSCQHAMPMGRQAGANAARSLLALPLQDYRQPRYVTCLDLGPWGAVFTSGWDRKVEMVEAEAKALKRQICREWIYPPQGSADTILAAAAPPEETEEAVS